MSIQRILIASVVAACAAIPAFASLQTYSTVANMESSLSSDTFSDISFTQGNLGTSTTADGVLFSISLSPQLTGIMSPSGWQAGTAIDSTYTSNFFTITLTLPSAVNAVALYADGQLSGSVVAMSVSDGSQTLTPTLTQSGSTPGFYAVSTTGAFTTFTLTSNTSGELLTVGDVTIGEAAPTPEVATFLLVGTGLFCMGYFRRRQAKAPARPKQPQGQQILAGATV